MTQFKGVHHLFMQVTFPGVSSYNGFGIGLAHLSSHDLTHWTVEDPTLVPGQWGGPMSLITCDKYSVVRRVWGPSEVYRFLIFAPPTPILLSGSYRRIFAVFIILARFF